MQVRVSNSSIACWIALRADGPAIINATCNVTVLEGYTGRTNLFNRLALLTKLPGYFVRHSSVGPQQPWIVYYRIQWSEWVVGVGRRLECGLLFGSKDNITAIKVEVRTYRMKV